ncbi:MAG: sigma factor [Janthinobacterium lividum]
MRAVLPLPEPQLWLTRFGDERYRFALGRVSDEAKAHDLVQGTLVSALNALDSFRGQP